MFKNLFKTGTFAILPPDKPQPRDSDPATWQPRPPKAKPKVTTVTKKGLVKQFGPVRPNGLTSKVLMFVLKTFLGLILKSLEEGNRVELRDFGVFEVRQSAPRTARNPQTGQKISIPARKTVTFRPSKLMRERVNK